MKISKHELQRFVDAFVTPGCSQGRFDLFVQLVHNETMRVALTRSKPGMTNRFSLQQSSQITVATENANNFQRLGVWSVNDQVGINRPETDWLGSEILAEVTKLGTLYRQ